MLSSSTSALGKIDADSSSLQAPTKLAGCSDQQGHLSGLLLAHTALSPQGQLTESLPCTTVQQELKAQPSYFAEPSDDVAAAAAARKPRLLTRVLSRLPSLAKDSSDSAAPPTQEEQFAKQVWTIAALSCRFVCDHATCAAAGSRRLCVWCSSA